MDGAWLRKDFGRFRGLVGGRHKPAGVAVARVAALRMARLGTPQRAAKGAARPKPFLDLCFGLPWTVEVFGEACVFELT
jgi:ABC-type antimicrobial peptide transport system permease subunit